MFKRLGQNKNLPAVTREALYALASLGLGLGKRVAAMLGCPLIVLCRWRDLSMQSYRVHNAYVSNRLGRLSRRSRQE